MQANAQWFGDRKSANDTPFIEKIDSNLWQNLYFLSGLVAEETPPCSDVWQHAAVAHVHGLGRPARGVDQKLILTGIAMRPTDGNIDKTADTHI